MDNKSTATLFGAIIASILVVLGLQPSGDKKGTVEVKAAGEPAAAKADSETDPLKPLRNFFEFREDKPDPEEDVYRLKAVANGLEFGKKPGKKKKAADAVGFDLSRHPERFEILIATVPDPVDTKFALCFDWYVDAIQRAYESRGFTLNSSWLPWPRNAKPDENPSRNYRLYPGTLLFQKKRSKTPPAENTGSLSLMENTGSLSLVFLVGETPIAGIHKMAMTKALDLRKQLLEEIDRLPLDWKGKTVLARFRNRLRILGPSFTGSAGSLERTLDNWLGEQVASRIGYVSQLLDGKRRFEPVKGELLKASLEAGLVAKPVIVNGSATAIDPDMYFRNAEFTSTQHRTKDINDAILSYLEFGPTTDVVRPSNLESSGKVAYLRESNTGFGSSFKDRPTAASKDNKQTDPQKKEKRRPLEFAYPISISQVKFELERHGPQAAGNVQLPRTEFDSLHLPTRGRNSPEGIPPYDAESAPVVAAEHIRLMLGAIHRENIRFVGIVGTDDRDVVFLNKLISKYCPSVQTFTASTNVILSMPEESYHMRGMIVGGTYSFDMDSQRWEGIGRTGRIFFPNQSSQGIYNAVLAHFREKDAWSVGKNYSESRPPFIGYRPPHAREDAALDNYPPIWISQIGNGGQNLPLHYYSGLPYQDRQPNSQGGQEHPQHFSVNAIVPKHENPVGDIPSGHKNLVADIPSGFLIFVLCVGIFRLATMAGSPREIWLHTFLKRCFVSTAHREVAAEKKPKKNVDRAPDPNGEKEETKTNIAKRYRDRISNVWNNRKDITKRYTDKLKEVVDTQFALERVQVLLGSVRQLVSGVFSACVAILCGEIIWACRSEWIVLNWLEVALLGSFAFLTLASCLYRNWWLTAACLICPVAGYYILFVRCFSEYDYLRINHLTEISSGLSPLIPLFSVVAAWIFLLHYAERCISLQSKWNSTRFELADHAGLGASPTPGFRMPSLPVPVWAAFLVLLGLFGIACIWIGSDIPHGAMLSGTRPVLLGCAVMGVALIAAAIFLLDSWWRLSSALQKMIDFGWSPALNSLPSATKQYFVKVVYFRFYRDIDHKKRSKRAALAVKARFPSKDDPHNTGVVFDCAKMKDDMFEDSDLVESIWPQMNGIYRVRQVSEFYGPDSPAEGAKEAGKPEPQPPQQIADADREKRISALEVLFITRLIAHLAAPFEMLRALAWPLMICPILLLLTVTSYPFHPEKYILFLVFALIAGCTAVLLYVLISINKNEFVSRILKTTPNRLSLDRDFLTNISVLVLPLLLSVAAQASGVFKLFLDPVLAILR